MRAMEEEEEEEVFITSGNWRGKHTGYRRCFKSTSARERKRIARLHQSVYNICCSDACHVITLLAVLLSLPL